MKTVTICGSMRFANEMKSIAYYLETQQKFNVLQCVYLPDNVVPTDEDIKMTPADKRRKKSEKPEKTPEIPLRV